MPSSPNMAKLEALKIKHTLPDAVVLQSNPGFTQRFSDTGAIWLCTEPSLLIDSDQPDTSPNWHARSGTVTAAPANPNTGNSKRSMVANIPCLAFQPKVNCGYCLPKAISGNDPFSIAVIYAPSMENEPRSLVTVNPVDGDNYLFLSERDNAIELTDNEASFFLRHPLTQDCDGFRLVIISRTKDGYALAVDQQKPRRETVTVESSGDEARAETCDLFIGCRSHRKGILKTLGEMQLADVFLWVDKDILAADPTTSTAENNPEYTLLLTYYTEVICRDV